VVLFSVGVFSFKWKLQRASYRHVLPFPHIQADTNTVQRISISALSMAKGKKSGPKYTDAKVKAKKAAGYKIDSASPVSVPEKANLVIPATKVELKVTTENLVDGDGRSKAKIDDFRKFYTSKVPSGSDMNLATFKSYEPVKKLLQESLVEGTKTSPKVLIFAYIS